MIKFNALHKLLRAMGLRGARYAFVLVCAKTHIRALYLLSLVALRLHFLQLPLLPFQHLVYTSLTSRT